MLINLSELLTVDGKEKDYSVSLETSLLHTPIGSFQMTENKPVSIHGMHTKNRKVTLEVAFSVNLVMPCDRCLEDVIVPIESEFQTELDLDASPEERLEALDEQPYINGYELDVDCMIRGEILLNLPTKVLCNQDCKGICKVCGTNLNYSTCGCCNQEPVNLRMSKIQEIFNANNIKEV